MVSRIMSGSFPLRRASFDFSVSSVALSITRIALTLFQVDVHAAYTSRLCLCTGARPGAGARGDRS
ncbi:hypothetical protein GCM10018771_12700 [Streptomyces cellulosae]|nr:hypothetical protein GCM10018771_12700 [Streptomyces cellulosae]